MNKILYILLSILQMGFFFLGITGHDVYYIVLACYVQLILIPEKELK